MRLLAIGSKLTVIRLYRYHGDAAGIRNHGRDVHRECVYPLAVDTKHVHDQIGSTLGTIYRPSLPARRKISIVVRVSMSDQKVRSKLN